MEDCSCLMMVFVLEVFMLENSGVYVGWLS